MMIRDFCLLVVSWSPLLSPPTVSAPLCHFPTLPSPLPIHPHCSLFIHQMQPISSSFPSPSNSLGFCFHFPFHLHVLPSLITFFPVALPTFFHSTLLSTLFQSLVIYSPDFSNFPHPDVFSQTWIFSCCKCVTIHGEIPHDWRWLGTGYKNNILTTDDNCSFWLMNTRKIRPWMSYAIVFLSYISSYILNLPHCNRYIAIYVAQIVLTILDHLCLLSDLHFILLVVSQQFDKHLYVTSSLNATQVQHRYTFAPKKVVLRKRWHS